MTDNCTGDASNVDGFALIDRHRSINLDNVGGNGLILAVAVDASGAEHLGIVERRALSDRTTGFSRSTPEHEMLGELPLEVVKRIAVAQRTRRPPKGAEE